jgi:hypothetical protein
VWNSRREGLLWGNFATGRSWLRFQSVSDPQRLILAIFCRIFPYVLVEEGLPLLSTSPPLLRDSFFARSPRSPLTPVIRK